MTMTDQILPPRLETASTRLEPFWRMCVQVPGAGAAALMAALEHMLPLTMGAYDRRAFQSGAGIERSRPREGAAAGAEDDTRPRPDVVEVSFQIPRDRAVLDRVVEAIVGAHGYQEPAIVVQDVLASRQKADDRDNPNRWWNRGGDWKASS